MRPARWVQQLWAVRWLRRVASEQVGGGVDATEALAGDRHLLDELRGGRRDMLELYFYIHISYIYIYIYDTYIYEYVMGVQ